jgi:heme-degrading monooxygenase HmoA
MVVSILTRRTRLRDRVQWEAALGTVLPRIRELLASQPGFVSVEYAWGAEDSGEFAQITAWNSLQDCRKYVREGGAATVATVEDAAVPTAPHPDGAWVRKTFETVS